ncbi:hypothetical protein G6514_000951 [Epicoccum nigrum]|nr:hypothetical protein G6514_000951 [Epicoccum nigrum]
MTDSYSKEAEERPNIGARTAAPSKSAATPPIWLGETTATPDEGDAVAAEADAEADLEAETEALADAADDADADEAEADALLKATITGLAGTIENALYNVMAGVKLEDDDVAWNGSDGLRIEYKAILSDLDCMHGGQGSCHDEWKDGTTHSG